MEDNLLLGQIRQVKRAFLQANKNGYALEEGTKEIAEIIGSAAFVIDKNGMLLAGHKGNVEIDGHLEHLTREGSIVGDKASPAMVKLDEPLLNNPYPSEIFADKIKKSATSEQNNSYSIIPIKGDGKLMAVLLLYHPDLYFEEKHLIIAEIGTALIGVILLQTTVDQEEENARNRELAEGAFESLSYSEVEAIREILKNISDNESIVVASKIADGLGITRSVIVNALRKFESAGIIESRSLGMKGTLIRVKNIQALEIITSRSANMESII